MAEGQEDGWAGPGWGLPTRERAGPKDTCQPCRGGSQGWLAAYFDLAAVGSEERLKALIPSDDSAVHSREDPDWRSTQLRTA